MMPIQRVYSYVIESKPNLLTPAHVDCRGELMLIVVGSI